MSIIFKKDCAITASVKNNGDTSRVLHRVEFENPARLSRVIETVTINIHG